MKNTITLKKISSKNGEIVLQKQSIVQKKDNKNIYF